MMNLLYSFLLSVLMSLVVGCAGGAGEPKVANEVEPPRVLRFGIDVEGYTIEDHQIDFGETVGRIIMANGASALDVDRMDRASREIFPLNKIQAGNSYTLFSKVVDTLGTKSLDYFVYQVDKVNYVVYELLPDSVSVYKGQKPVVMQRHKESAQIESSMWGAIMEHDLPYSLGAELEEIYQWSIDFFGIQPGDNFTVIYDEKFVDDSVSIGVGQIWGAKFTHGGVTHYAIPFKQDGRVTFWEEDGGSLRKMMLKAPLKYSRISSKFSNARYHPIYKIYRPHHGVDYAAPSGTPVHSVADGVVVEKAYQKGGGGYYLKIQHPQKLMTGYLHLSRYAKGMAVGTHVVQGQLIGYVGSTGASTGPHLDFRVWRNGVAIDPLKIPQEPTEPIKVENREAFDFVKSRVMAELDGDLAADKRICDLDSLAIPQRDTISLNDE